jgi:hypothetical protein
MPSRWNVAEEIVDGARQRFLARGLRGCAAFETHSDQGRPIIAAQRQDCFAVR